ncbi:DUF2806 domain-containing protein [Brachyspira innocens]|uniref:DUF2806 domain-containing protein n=1 Tax=Brachyspira innocens TaxID=13264 RepID=UPI000370EF7F|nr:DUF2806 domain-containing protein [Brachyspira innocens]
MYINISSKVIEKLIDTINSSIGEWLKPMQMKRIADAKSYESKSETDSKIYEIEKISEIISKNQLSSINYDNNGIKISNEHLLLVENTITRLIKQELSRTSNIQNVIDKTYDILKDEEDVSDKPVTKDWTFKFFRAIEDVSDEKMQDLWAKLLAGEIKQPGSFSYRTLETLKNMTSDEAELFTKVAKSLFLGSLNSSCLFKNIDLIAKEGIYYKDILKFMEIGLISSSEESQLKIDDNKLSIALFNKNYVFEAKLVNNVETRYFHISIYLISEIGKDILKLIDDKYSNDEFFKNNIKEIRDNIKNIYKDSVKLKLQKIKNIDLENNIIYPIDENENLINDI